MKSVMVHSFSQVPKADIPRSSFDRSHGFKTTFDSGFLVPIFRDFAVPGDTFNLSATTFGRVSTPIVPFMDNLHLDTFFFAVPVRLLWTNFEKFCGAQDNPTDSTDFLIPQIVSPASTGWTYASVADYFGIPTGVAGLSHSALYHRAYNLVWDQWFRDQNLQTRPAIHKGDGPDPATDYPLLRRGKRHDYFTSCLPWPQKGTAVKLPLGTDAPVVAANTTFGPRFNVGGGANPDGQMYYNNASTTWSVGFAPNNTGEAKWSNPNLKADLANATAATMNAFRQAVQIQKLYERDARGGTRYAEIIRSHFGVTSLDARLQRPEYLGGNSTPINVNPIAQTSATQAGVTPQGNLAGMATVSSSGTGFTKSFDEHCIIIGLANVRADLSYQQGLDRLLSARSRWDMYWPGLANIGEQEVRNKEIYAQGSANPAVDDGIFGYQERYAEYRYKPSLITGKFRSTNAQPMDIWHLSQKFTSLPVLNSTFIQDTPPLNRVVAVPTEPQLFLDVYYNYKCARPMPLFGVPGLGDRF